MCLIEQAQAREQNAQGDEPGKHRVSDYRLVRTGGECGRDAVAAVAKRPACE